MDSQKEISRLSELSFPLVGIALSLFAVVSFFLTALHDAPLEEDILSFYQAHLLAHEKPLFVDFYEKRLSIEQHGSASHLIKIQTASSEKNQTTFITFLLADRGFRDYLQQKAPLYFSDEVAASWSRANQELTSKLDSLLSQQLSITPEQFRSHPRFSSIITQPFIETSLLNLISNCFLLLLIFACLEQGIRRSRLLLFLLGGLICSSIIVIAAGNMTTPPMNGLNLPVYLSLSLLIGLNLPKVKLFSSKVYIFSAIFGVILLCKAAVDAYFAYLSLVEALIVALLIIPAAGLGWRYVAWFKTEQKTSHALETTNDELDPESRKIYADAMAAISRFNFKYARKALQELNTKHPEAKNIRDSAYHLEKLYPNDKYFWPLAQGRIEDALKANNLAQMRAIFNDIQKAAPKREQAKEQIAPEYYLKMLVVFNAQGDLESAEKAFMFLELAGNSELVIDACRLLIESFARKQMQVKADRYSDLLASYQH